MEKQWIHFPHNIDARQLGDGNVTSIHKLLLSLITSEFAFQNIFTTSKLPTQTDFSKFHQSGGLSHLLEQIFFVVSFLFHLHSLQLPVSAQLLIGEHLYVQWLIIAYLEIEDDLPHLNVDSEKSMSSFHNPPTPESPARAQAFREFSSY